ncbi:sensor histidine kinase [Bacillus massiliglaciei]|uniref:sensor histidine kinase n=1 Tax=Bacillus massiliglaciei TaxID=1816693 RepID=UPI000A4E74B9|nr:HAMP domain-containing sensor histidine kinase [Bacillus massiliglaciei]
MATKLKGKWALTIWTAVLTIGLSGVLLILTKGSEYLGRGYFDSGEFQGRYDQFVSMLNSFELSGQNIEDAKKNLKVTKEEIEAHRYEYGELEEQLANIHAQYDNKIKEMKGAGNKEAADFYTAERDKKLKDITQNFKSDEYVEKKILAEKEKQLENYFEQLDKNERNQFENDKKVFSYNLTNVQTREEYSNVSHSEEKTGKPAFLFQKKYEDGDYLITNSYNDSVEEYPADPVQEALSGEYEGDITIMKNAPASHPLIKEYRGFQIAQKFFYFYSILSLVMLALSLFIFRRAKLGEPQPEGGFGRLYRKLPIDLRAASAVGTSLILMIYLYVFPNRSFSWPFYDGRFDGSAAADAVAAFILLAFLIAFTFLQWREFAAAAKEDIGPEWQRSFIIRTVNAIKMYFYSKSIGVQVILLFSIVFLAGVGAGGVILENSLIIIYLPLLIFIGIPVFLFLFRRIVDFQSILKNTDELAAGNLEPDLRLKGRSVLARMAQNINTLKYGVKSSQKAQVKSERLKTELITNVSHDLRTPLTSIITYTELLKSPGLAEEERDSYIQIIDRKSKRLKVLIDDLFEVSKMASGNAELNREKADLAQLLQQSLAEREEAIRTSSLQFRLTNLEKPVIAEVDGQKMWRVFDNLIGNILKYSMEYSRVYLSLHEETDEAVITFKNVTKYELGDNVDELFERFKRGDTSRKTEGSGLGLAIAKSIVDLHGGDMDIQIDGDLFKVTLRLPKISEQ